MAIDKPKRTSKPRRTKHVKVLVTRDEKKRLEADAREAEVSASTWLRTGRLPEGGTTTRDDAQRIAEALSAVPLKVTAR